MHPVLIQEQALPDARYQLQLALLPVAIDIEGPARLYATQHAHQPFRMADRPQGPSKDQPVEATQRSRNLFLMFRDKLLHGVSVPPKIWRSCRTTTSYRERKRLLRLVAALPRCVIGKSAGNVQG